MFSTPRGERLHIGIFGKRNSGKSSFINAITKQNVSIVSEIAGTTTDPVQKTMEINGVGPCLFIDTAGFDDEGTLGNLRNKKTYDMLKSIDIAIIIVSDENPEAELNFIKQTNRIPKILLINKCDILGDKTGKIKNILAKTGLPIICISAKTNYNMENVIEQIKIITPYREKNILGDIVQKNDLVMLVMPQDIQAPQGRLILPQVQVIRSLLDKHCVTMCTTKEEFLQALSFLVKPPKIIITDSQIFDFVYNNKPKESLLSSFSVLLAKYKGNINDFVSGANKLETLNENAHILIAEACTHVPLDEDIGRVKIPRLLKQKFGDKIIIDLVSGNNFPDNLTQYDLVIHCGGCMFNRNYMLSRIEQARKQNVPITNYGIAIAKLKGILDKIYF